MTLRRNLARKLVKYLAPGICFAAFALNAFAQDQAPAPESQKWPKKPSYTLRLGVYFPGKSTTIRVDTKSDTGIVPGTTLKLEDVLGLKAAPAVFRGAADIRIAPWFGLELGYYKINRSKNQVINKAIQVGDTVFAVGQTLTTTFDTATFRGDFKFYILHKPRLDLGVYLGTDAVQFDLSIENQDKTLVERRSVWAPLPSLGVHFNYTVIPNLYVYGKAGYFYFGLTKNAKLTAATFSVNLDYYFYKFLGVGAAFEYNYDKGEMNLLKYNGLIKYGLAGIQIYAVVGY
jgi:hypothetical protein